MSSKPKLLHRRQALAAFGAGALTLLSRETRADAIGDALAEVTRARAGLRTLVASFSQERTIGLLSTAVTSEGRLTLVRPDRLRWELLPPDAMTYWITPEGFSFATPNGGASVGKGGAGRFGAVLGDLLVMLGGDLEKLRGRYDLEVERDAAGLVLRAAPKAEDVRKHVRRLELSAGPELWRVKRVTIEEAGGDASVITFGDVARDVAVDPERMRPPRG